MNLFYISILLCFPFLSGCIKNLSEKKEPVEELKEEKPSGAPVLSTDCKNVIIDNIDNIHLHQNDLDDFYKKYIVKLKLNSPKLKNEINCTGIALENNLIITAGHCLKGVSNDTHLINFTKIEIVKGLKRKKDLLPKDYEEVRNLSDVESYRADLFTNDDSISDIGFIKLKNNKSFKNFKTTSVKYYKNINELKNCTKTASFGFTSNKVYFGEIVFPTDKQLDGTLFGKPNKNKVFCVTKLMKEGDSGGPLIIINKNQFYVIGLVQIGAAKGSDLCNIGEDVTLFTSIEPFVSWIEKESKVKLFHN